ncbi:MAG: MFS transporter [Planctomycetes bacterium]|nr:MFS transporter [Planctomycetota bacterium]
MRTRRKPRAAAPEAHDRPRLGRGFWYTYLANFAMMVAVSVLYRYHDFVTAVGGDEMQLGLIVGAGMVGATLMRLWQGSAIDIYGTRVVWIVSAGAFIACSLGHLLVDDASGVAIFALRIGWQMSLAGFVGASISFVSGLVSAQHTVEVVATLGTSGFLGTIVGNTLGDFLTAAQFSHNHMFVVAAVLGTCMLLLGLMSGGGEAHSASRRRPPLWWLVRRYHPGATIVMSVACGFGLSVPTIFLRPFAKSLGIIEISCFFLPYMFVALVARIITRRWSARWGTRRIIIAGGALLAVGTASFALVTSPWHMWLPATLMGVAHAVLFPTVVAGGSSSFPARHRGVGTTLMLAGFDLGALLAFVSVGSMIVSARGAGLPEYSTTFIAVATILAITAAIYAAEPWWSRAGRAKATR